MSILKLIKEIYRYIKYYRHDVYVKVKSEWDTDKYKLD